MAYDEDLAADIRALMGGEEGLTERRMFGGLAFMVAGNMALAAGSNGRMMVRTDAERSESLLDPPRVVLVEMRGRSMRGWLDVDATGLDGDALGTWVERGIAFARSLPPK